MEKDLIVIGGGPGGYVAAIRAAQLGAKVVLIDEDKLGGTCLNRGCIPTKAFFKNAQVINTINSAEEFGISTGDFSFDMKMVQERKEDIVERLRGGIQQLLKANGVECVQGRGRLIDSRSVEVVSSLGNKETLDAKNILIATGSLPTMLPIPGMELPKVMTSNEVLELDRIPKSMVIIGGGVVGIEFAGIFHSFGTEVTVLEYLPHILPTMDEEIVRRLTMLLKRRGIKIETSIEVKEVCRRGEEGLVVKALGKKGEAELLGETVLVSAGRTINIDGLNLYETGIKYDRKGIIVDEKFRTSLPSVYAIGDVIGGQMLAHVASEEGIAAVENMLGHDAGINYDDVPSCVFSFPEIAAVGLTEQEAKKRNIPYLVSKFPFGANGKALTMGESDGLVKVIGEKDTGKIIGAHILGPHASDLIHEAALAVENGLTANDIGKTVHAHPTLGEAFLEAALGIDNKAIHLAPPKVK
ncbi:MAG: dihydrolipoyl dehydrogenase [Desulfitobacteriaceae bacterium]|nr:dihydrolipoyl dehydrogenase [Desulfitobacteriaceae bacterium]MDD4752375.1 dihydrolipoyl dehydrogenase [Desulfitobacteriaceae bacterium]